MNAMGVQMTDQEVRQMFSAIDADSKRMKEIGLMIEIVF